MLETFFFFPLLEQYVGLPVREGAERPALLDFHGWRVTAEGALPLLHELAECSSRAPQCLDVSLCSLAF